MFGKLPPLHALTAFEAIARLGSFARAADELCLTHGAVSHRIRQLEESLGAKLFDRLGRTVRLTAAGERFLERVRESLRQLKTASTEMATLDRRRLRVSTSPAIASNWLAYRLADFQRDHPRIDLEIESNMTVVDLRRGEADVCIRYGNGKWPGCAAERLFTDELYPLCSPEYARRTAPFRAPADLARAVLLRATPKLPWRLWFDAAGLDWDEPRAGPIFAEVNVMLDAAANGAGVALAGRIAAGPYLGSGRLVRLYDIGVPAPHSFHAVRLETQATRPEIGAFVAWLRAQAAVDLFEAAADPGRERERRLDAMIEHLPAGAVMIDGERLTMNRAAEAITGYSRTELTTLGDWFRAIFGHRAASVRRSYEKDKVRGAPVRCTNRIRRKDGRERLVEFSSTVNPSSEIWLLDDVSAREAS